MAETLYPPQCFLHIVLRLENNTRQNRAFLPALPRDTELVRVPVTGVCDYF